MNRKEKRIHRKQCDIYTRMLCEVIEREHAALREQGYTEEELEVGGPHHETVSRAIHIGVTDAKVNAAFRAAGLPEAHGERMHLIHMGQYEEPSPEQMEEILRWLAPHVREATEQLAEEQDTTLKPRAQ